MPVSTSRITRSRSVIAGHATGCGTGSARVVDRRGSRRCPAVPSRRRAHAEPVARISSAVAARPSTKIRPSASKVVLVAATTAPGSVGTLPRLSDLDGARTSSRVPPRAHERNDSRGDGGIGTHRPAQEGRPGESNRHGGRDPAELGGERFGGCDHEQGVRQASPAGRSCGTTRRLGHRPTRPDRGR